MASTLENCEFCGYQFAAECGRYGCPNCLGEYESLENEMNENITYQITVTGGHKINQFTTSSPPHHMEDVCRRARENESGKATEYANCGIDITARVVYGRASS